MSDEYEIEMSPLCREVESGGITVQVHIYRGVDTEWTLEVVDEERASIVWDDMFKTDVLAHEAFNEALMREGLAAIVAGDE